MAQEESEIAKAEAEYRAANAAVDAAYWRFSRSTSRSLHGIDSAALYARRNAARERLLTLRHKASR